MNPLWIAITHEPLDGASNWFGHLERFFLSYTLWNICWVSVVHSPPPFFLGITLANWFEKGEKIHLSVVLVTDIVNSEYAKTFESSVTKIKDVWSLLKQTERNYAKENTFHLFPHSWCREGKQWEEGETLGSPALVTFISDERQGIINVLGIYR